MHPIAEKIRAANDRKSRLLPRQVKEWDETVHLRSWTGRERADFLKYTKELQTRVQAGEAIADSMLDIYVCVHAIADAEGTLIFNGDGEEILLDKDSTLVETLAAEILEHNGLGKSAQERASKNSMSSQSSDSGTSSLVI